MPAALPGRADPGRATRLWAVVLLLLAAASCQEETEADPMGAVREVLGEHVRHESAMLSILEQNRGDTARAVALIRAYCREHGARMSEIAQQRRLLESQPTAFAQAMSIYGETLSANFARRQRLAAEAPALMADPSVRAALARLDAL